MTFNDILKNSFLEQFSVNDYTIESILLTLTITSAISIYIYFVYGILSKKTFYSRSFAISLVAISILIAAIIMTIKSNIIISLGMVGALSIVRFRTPVKEPLDLVFLFWSITVGIICGANLYSIAIIASILITIITAILNMLPNQDEDKLLLLSLNNIDSETEIINIIKNNTKTYKICTKTKNINGVELILKIKSKNEETLLSELSKLKEINTIEIINQDNN